MSLRHLVFIVNPRSGVERQKAIQDGIDNYLDQSQYSYEIVHTQYARHGTTLAREAADKGAWAVVAVGGDGSVNDVVQGLDGTGCRLAIIPKGSGNGMARSLGISIDTNEAIKTISGGKTQNIDLGYANGKPFISNAGVAFDALISKEFAKSTKRGFLVYSWLVTKHMWLYKPRHWQIKVDGKPVNEKAFMVVVANGQLFGYDFRIAPMASFTDGILDLIIVKSFPRILGGIIAYRAMKGTIHKSPYVRHFAGKEITISHPTLCLMQADGDAADCENSITFTIKQGALPVLVP